jgi:hypothetical protein
MTIITKVQKNRWQIWQFSFPTKLTFHTNEESFTPCASTVLSEKKCSTTFHKNLIMIIIDIAQAGEKKFLTLSINSCPVSPVKHLVN